MTTTLTVTAAEIALLLREAGPDAADVRAVIGIVPDEQTDAVASAALGSLLLRDLASADDGRLRLAPPLAAVAEGLAEAAYWIEMGLVATDIADGAVILEGPSERLLVTPRAFRCFEISGIERSVPAGVPVADIARTFLTRFKPGVVSMRCTIRGAGPGDAWVSVAADTNGWTVASPNHTGDHLTEDAALDRCRHALEDVVPAGRP
jgi:hypothetical protein